MTKTTSGSGRTRARRRKKEKPAELAEVVKLPTHVLENVVEEPDYQCQDCRDTGWARRTRDDGSIEQLGKCYCQHPARNPKLVKKLLAECGLARREIRAAFTKWNDDSEPSPSWAFDWLDWSLRFGEDECPESLRDALRPNGPASSWALTLLGPSGVGKTMTAAKLARSYLERGGRGLLWVSVRTVYRDVMAEKAAEGSSQLERWIESASLLVFDEFGAVGEKAAAEQSDWFETRAAEREREELPTVFTSNARGLDSFDPRIESRLAAGYYREMSGPDRRDL